MKIIKSFTAIIVCLCATTVLHAQETKAEVATKSEVKVPPSAVIANKPSPKPEFKPQPQVAATPTAAPATAETPSPLTRKEDAKPAEMEKMEMNALTPITIETPGGEQGRKIMEGKAEGTKSTGPTTPNTSNPGLQPPSTKPAGLKTQQ